MTEANSNEARVSITSDADIAEARDRAREAAADMGFSLMDVTLISACVSELSRKVLNNGRRGEIVLSWQCKRPACLVVEASDNGPGVLPQALAPRAGSESRRGSDDLFFAWRSMDELTVVVDPGHATRIVARKWLW